MAAAPVHQPSPGVPTSPRELATDPRMLDGGWRDRHGRTLFEVLVVQLGDVAEATRLWRDAAIIVESTPVGMPLVRDRREPLPFEKVWLADIGAADLHAPVPGEEVTVCGIATVDYGYRIPFSQVVGRRPRMCLTCYGAS